MTEIFFRGFSSFGLNWECYTAGDLEEPNLVAAELESNMADTVKDT